MRSPLALMILLACHVAHPSPDDHWPQKCGESEPDRLWCVRQHWGSMRDAIALSSLRSIHCDLCHVGSAAAPAAHPSLTELALQRTRLDDPHSLGALVNLESLTLTDTGLRDLRAGSRGGAGASAEGQARRRDDHESVVRLRAAEIHSLTRGIALGQSSSRRFVGSRRSASTILEAVGAAAKALVALVRLPTGALQDDVAVIVCRERA